MRGKGKRIARPEPVYVRTRKSDGWKSVDLNEFVRDPRVVAQIKRLSREETREVPQS